MRDSVVVRLSLLLIATAIFVFGSSVIVSAGKKCISIGEKQVCFDDGKNKKKNKNDAGGADAGNNNAPANDNAPADDNAAPDNATPDNAAPQNTGNKCQGEVACPPGYVVLDKPNKYGACCEPREGFCPPDRPSGTPPNCCAEGTTFREGACWPTNCPPGTVGTPPHCDRTCAPGKVKVDQTCYEPARHHRHTTQMLLPCRTGLGCRSQRLQRAAEMPRRHDRHAAQMQVPQGKRAQ
jgi:hypothetical protein